MSLTRALPAPILLTTLLIAIQLLSSSLGTDMPREVPVGPRRKAEPKIIEKKQARPPKVPEPLVETAEELLQLKPGQIDKMPMEQRVKYLHAFLAQQTSKAGDKTGTAVGAANDRCNPDHKFYHCCHQVAATCTLTNPEYMMSAACQYPPAGLSLPQQICLATYINEYIMCYGDGQDNTDCCSKAGVPPECTWALIFKADCRDFCHANHHMTDAKTGYRCCEDYVKQIAECNKKASNMDTDTAAVKYGFCKRDCTPPWPVACKQGKTAERKPLL